MLGLCGLANGVFSLIHSLVALMLDEFIIGICIGFLETGKGKLVKSKVILILIIMHICVHLVRSFLTIWIKTLKILALPPPK